MDTALMPIEAHALQPIPDAHIRPLWHDLGQVYIQTTSQIGPQAGVGFI